MGKSAIARYRTPAIYQSNHCINASHASHLPSISPRYAKSPRTYNTSYTYTNIKKTHNTLELMRRWTFDLDIELGHGQPASYWARPVKKDDGLEVIMWIRCLRGERLPTASYARCPNLTNFFSCRRSSDRGGIEIVCRLFSTHQPTTHLRSRHRINPRSTRFVSGNAGAYRWRPPKCYVYQWSTGREVARDVLRSFSQFPRPEKCPFFVIGDGSRCFLVNFLHNSGQISFSQTPGRHPPYITGLRVNSDPRVSRSP